MKHVINVQTAASSEITPPASETGVVTSSHSACACVRACVRKSSTGCPRSARRAGKLQLCLGWRRSALCADGERFNWSIDFDSGELCYIKDDSMSGAMCL